MNPRTRVLAIAATAVALLALTTAPAAAERAAFRDPADAAPSLTDIRRVTVDHGRERVSVRVLFTDLRRHSDGGASGLTLLLDTRPARSGPEFRLTTGLQAGTDYHLVRIRDGRPVGEPLTCSHRVRLDFANEVARFSAARGCLGFPDRVRLGVKMTDASEPVVDWLGKRRSFTPWLASS